MKFSKYQALGNDMLVIDPARFPIPLTPDIIARLCNRHFGVGADGICYGPLPNQKNRQTMRFFNPDGSEAEKSGNGLRIFARYLWDVGYETGNSFQIWIHGESVPVRFLDDQAHTISMGMGRLSFIWEHKPLPVGDEVYETTAVSIGNPHCIIVSRDLAAIHQVGPLLESASPFPQGTNVQLMKIIDNHKIQIEIWERGAGYTLASGTSACAAAGTAVRLGYCQSPVEVHMVGGTSQVSINEDWDLVLEGEVSAVYQATLAADMQKALLVSG